jgi:type IV secretion system protein VirB4
LFIKGEYSFLFKPVDDTIAESRFTVFELNNLMNMGEDIRKFVLGYLFHKIENQFGDKLTQVIIDEGSTILKDEYFLKRYIKWLDTARKNNCYVITATQKITDIPMQALSTILNACFTQIFLPNPAANQPLNQKFYKELGLLEGDIDALEKAQPKRDYFIRKFEGNQVRKQMFSLCLCNKQLDILTNVKKGR